MAPARSGTDPTRSHDNRLRAESFGRLAADYDAVRPHYPAPVVDLVLAGDPVSAPVGPRLRVLDVGAGTGILTRAMAAAGADVVGNEIDPAMAAVAREHGLTVHVGPFEELVLPDRFDRITAGQAWHWVHPERGLAAARRLLAPDGQLWLVWNLGAVRPDVQAALDMVYERVAAAIDTASVSRGGGRAGAEATGARLAAVADVVTHDVRWSRTYTSAEWIALVRTHSDHATLAADVREALLARLGAAIDAHGGEVPVAYTTHAVVARGLADGI